jgi:hypothetical protein
LAFLFATAEAVSAATQRSQPLPSRAMVMDLYADALEQSAHAAADEVRAREPFRTLAHRVCRILTPCALYVVALHW